MNEETGYDHSYDDNVKLEDALTPEQLNAFADSIQDNIADSVDDNDRFGDWPDFPLKAGQMFGVSPRGVRKHDDLMYVQDFLGTEQTGVFDQALASAVRKFKGRSGSGLIGKSTWDDLRRAAQEN